MKPRLLDLFCGAGGCTKGYQRAGFYVVGVDINPQPNYCGDEFIRGDALQILTKWPLGQQFDAIHASPPCQFATHAKWLGNRGRDDHQNFIPTTRELLAQTGLPYVIENVDDARSELVHPVLLCGSMFGLPIRRHRLFESNVPLFVPTCQHGVERERRFPGTPREDGSRPDSRVVNQMASGTTHEMLAEAFGIDWIKAPGRKRPTNDLCEAIPPAYTELIGHQLMQHVSRAEVAA